MRCLCLTKKGERCKKNIENGKYCYLHIKCEHEYVEPKQIVESIAKTNSNHMAETKQIVETKPVVQVKQIVEPKPVVQVKQIVEPKHVVQVKQIVKPQPVVRVKQIVEPNPVVQVKQIVEPKKIIGSGAFGIVERLSNTDVVKTMKLYYDFASHELHGENIKECAFLSTYHKCTAMTTISDVKFDLPEKLKIIMTNHGPTLQDILEKMKYHERIILLPFLMAQFSYILSFMKKIHVAHMDIKPANICTQMINGKIILTLIDWGKCELIHKESETTCGTLVFADPQYIKQDHKATHEYDMFGIGMTLAYFITKKHVDLDEWTPKIIDTDQKCIDATTIADSKHDIKEVVGSETYETLLKMIILDESKRITPEELALIYQPNVLFTDPKNQYDTQCITTLPLPPYNQKILTRGMFTVVVKWMVEVSFKLKTIKCVSWAVKLMYLYIHRVQIDKANFQLVGMACLTISCYVNGIPGITHDIIYLSDNAYTAKQMNKMIINILNSLKFMVFPTEIPSEILFGIIPHEDLILFYNDTKYQIMPESEKLVFLKKKYGNPI